MPESVAATTWSVMASTWGMAYLGVAVRGSRIIAVMASASRLIAIGTRFHSVLVSCLVAGGDSNWRISAKSPAGGRGSGQSPTQGGTESRSAACRDAGTTRFRTYVHITGWHAG